MPLFLEEEKLLFKPLYVPVCINGQTKKFHKNYTYLQIVLIFWILSEWAFTVLLFSTRLQF